jgi:hypothetical protein
MASHRGGPRRHSDPDPRFGRQFNRPGPLLSGRGRPSSLKHLCDSGRRNRQGAKGDSAGRARQIMEVADPQWVGERMHNGGLSSGEGVIWAVCDAIRQLERKGKGAGAERAEIIVDPASPISDYTSSRQNSRGRSR